MNKVTKKIGLFATFVATMACTISSFANYKSSGSYALLSSDVEALSNTESGQGGTSLKCYCSVKEENCAVNNWGDDIRASGVNVKCWDFHENCNL